MHYAVFRQELAVVQLLEREGADIYLCSGDGLNCLHLAAQGGSTLLMVTLSPAIALLHRQGHAHRLH